jgi:hypothetical protein
VANKEKNTPRHSTQGGARYKSTTEQRQLLLKITLSLLSRLTGAPVTPRSLFFPGVPPVPLGTGIKMTRAPPTWRAIFKNPNLTQFVWKKVGKSAGGGWRRAEIINDWARGARKKRMESSKSRMGLRRFERAVTHSLTAARRWAARRFSELGIRRPNKKRVAAAAFLVAGATNGLLESDFFIWITYLSPELARAGWMLGFFSVCSST